jgi:hypothetical protein
MSSETPVSAIVPARNEEATIGAAVESLAAQPEIKEIIVVNDQSTDGTAAVLLRLAARFPQLRLLETRELPAGWVGKNYAVSLGTAQAIGDWLLFTDADGVHLPGSLAHALADARAHVAALVSYSPEQELRTWWEKSLIPFVYVRLARKFSFDEVNDPDCSAAAANGQYLLIRRDEYERIGGHDAVAGEVLEDVALARLAKRAGAHLYFASGYGIIRVRMYRTFGAMWQGWTKNLYPLMGEVVEWPEPAVSADSQAASQEKPAEGVRQKAAGRSSRAVGRELFRVVPWIPLLLLLLTVVHPIIGVVGAGLLAARHAAYAGELRKNRFPAGLALYYFPGVLLYAAVLLNSELHYARGRVAWKGREYPVGKRDS